MQITSTKAEHNLPKGFYTPIIALEFIETQEQVRTFFDVENAEQYKQSILLGNQLDYIFMIIYSAFLFFVALYLYQKSPIKIILIAIALIPIACVTDALENIQIYRITKNINADLKTFLTYLKLFTWIKWSSLAVVFACFAIYYVQHQKRLLAFVVAVPFLFLPIAFFAHSTVIEFFALSIVAIFIVIFIYIVLEYKKQLTV